MATRKIFLVLLAVSLVTISAAVLRAQASAEHEATRAQNSFVNDRCDWLCRLQLEQGQRLEGAWAWTVTPVVPPGAPPPPTARAFGTVARGGGLTIYVRNAPNGPHYGAQHGVWKHLGGNEYAFTSLRDEFDAQGNFLGTSKIVVRLRLNGNDEFVGVGSREFRDGAGNIADVIRCSTIKGERIKIEPLPDQCQSITPPQ